MRELLFSLKPTTRYGFDEVETPEPKTYTQEEVDALVQERSNASFQAGVKKTTADLQQTETNQELEELRAFKEQQVAQTEFNNTMNDVKPIFRELGGRKGGLKPFTESIQSEIKGLKGDELSAKIRSLKKEHGYHFDASSTSIGKDLRDNAGNKPKPKPKTYPNSTIIYTK